jgi:hypothetical protein
MSLSKEDNSKLTYVFVSWDKALSERVVLQLLPFFNTFSYLCESGFSNKAVTKAKHRKGQNAGPDLRIQLSNMQAKEGEKL